MTVAFFCNSLTQLEPQQCPARNRIAEAAEVGWRVGDEIVEVNAKAVSSREERLPCLETV